MAAKQAQINTQEAAFLAIKPLAYISQSESEMAKFLTLTGIAVADVIRLKENLKFLGGVLDFMCADESLLLAFCASENFAPEQIQAARHHLAGHAV